MEQNVSMDRLTRKGRRRGSLLAHLALVLTDTALRIRRRPAKHYQPSMPDEGELRVVTWNVGYFSPAPVKSAHESDTGAIVEVLRHTFPHVVILQELASTWQARRIARAMGDGWRAFAIPAGIRGQYLGAATCLPVNTFQVRQAGGKMMLGLSLRVESDTLFVAALHAPHPLRGPEKTRAYIREALDWGRSRTEDCVVLGGDLNYHFALPVDPLRRPSRLYDEIRRDFSDSTVSIGPTFYARTRIDHVFHSPKRLPVVPQGTGLIELPMRLGSRPGWRDHRPIVVTLDRS